MQLRQLVAQREFALLEPLHLQLVRVARAMQRFDGGVEVAVLFFEALDGGQRF